MKNKSFNTQNKIMVLTHVLILAFCIIALVFLLLYPFLYTFLFNLPEKEVLVIGLDGGDYEIIQSLIEKNKLPNFKAIVTEDNFVPYYNGNLASYQAWDSLTDCNGKTLWNVLNERNVTFGTLYWPNVPEKGLFMIPDEFENKREWPEDVYDSKALLIFKNPVTEFFRKIYWVIDIMFPTNKIEKDLVYEFYLLDRNAREFFYLREKFKPHLSFLVFSSPFRLEQYLWMYAYPEKFGNYVTEKEKEKYGKVIENYYVELDDFIGKLNKLGKTIIIVSNRGVTEVYNPPKMVDKIDINKILKGMGLLEFDYRGEIDFSKTKAYTLEEGLDMELKINILGTNISEIKEKLKNIFDEARSLPSGIKMFSVEESEKTIVLKRNIPLIIEDDRFSISNKTFLFSDYIFRRVISAEPEENGFIIINKNVELPKDMTSKDFCSLLLNLTS